MKPTMELRWFIDRYEVFEEKFSRIVTKDMVLQQKWVEDDYPYESLGIKKFEWRDVPTIYSDIEKLALYDLEGRN